MIQGVRHLLISLSLPDTGWLGQNSTGIAHAVAALIRKVCEGKAQPRREVQYVVLNHPDIKGT